MIFDCWVSNEIHQCNNITKMKKTRDNDEEGHPLLISYDDINSSYEINSPKLNAIIAKGVAKQLAKWPSHLFTIFMTVCIILIGFSFFTFVSIILFSIDINTRISRNVKMEEYPNLYFVKHASHAWSRDELCAIESSAREYPDLNVYIVNVPRHQSALSLASPVNTSLTLNSITGEDSVNALIGKYMNVHTIDVVTQTLFKKSPVEKNYNKFNEIVLVMAVKSQLLWNYSGIGMDPSQVDQVASLKQYICRPTESCKPMKNAAISLDGSIQVSPFPCHAFFELFLEALSNKFNNGEEIVKDTYKTFCNGQEKCVGIEIFNYQSTNMREHPLCPVILPSYSYMSKDLISYKRTTPSQHQSSPTEKEKSMKIEKSTGLNSY